MLRRRSRRRRLRRAPATLVLLLIAAVAVSYGDRVGGSGANGGGGAPGSSGGSGPTAPTGAETARVERVVDGDTIRLRGVGPVRLIGVDTPETYGGRDECFGPEATRYVEGLLPRGARVRYVVGEDSRDRYGRLLAYLYLRDGASLNHALVAAGYARTLTIPPNDRYAPTFERAEEGARRARHGMWARPGCAGE
ncbi:MAG TPA: thermonuclease family protein [Thermoleophilaceae bacterium]|jgi:endonuclease YncB( thermonuclease family)